MAYTKPAECLFDPRIDDAALQGLESHATGAPMPGWIRDDDLLACAWRAGRTQAADKAREVATNGA